jgi:hypothetical protein
MKRLLFALLILLGAAPAAAAESHWTGPAWYEVADTIVGAIVWSGPYSSEQDCKAHLTPNDTDADYSCEYLGEKPTWDE